VPPSQHKTPRVPFVSVNAHLTTNTVTSASFTMMPPPSTNVIQLDTFPAFINRPAMRLQPKVYAIYLETLNSTNLNKLDMFLTALAQAGHNKYNDPFHWFLPQKLRIVQCRASDTPGSMPNHQVRLENISSRPAKEDIINFLENTIHAVPLGVTVVTNGALDRAVLYPTDAWTQVRTVLLQTQQVIEQELGRDRTIHGGMIEYKDPNQQIASYNWTMNPSRPPLPGTNGDPPMKAKIQWVTNSGQKIAISGISNPQPTPSSSAQKRPASPSSNVQTEENVPEPPISSTPTTHETVSPTITLCLPAAKVQRLSELLIELGNILGSQTSN
jgi:hypothetical protein